MLSLSAKFVTPLLPERALPVSYIYIVFAPLHRSSIWRSIVKFGRSALHSRSFATAPADKIWPRSVHGMTSNLYISADYEDKLQTSGLRY